jgi:hypothetical protein
LGYSGEALNAFERDFFPAAEPRGFILPAQLQSPDQFRELVAALRECVGRNDAPVLIDQEGGRVARLRPPHWPLYPSAARFASLPDPLAERAAHLAARLIAADQAGLGDHGRLQCRCWISRVAGRTRSPGLWKRTSRASPEPSARGCWTAAPYCLSSSTYPATAGPGLTVTTLVPKAKRSIRNRRARISRRSVRWRRCPEIGTVARRLIDREFIGKAALHIL